MAGEMVPWRPRLARSSATTRPRRRPRVPHVTPCHWHNDWLLRHEDSADDGSICMSDLKDISARWSDGVLTPAMEAR